MMRLMMLRDIRQKASTLILATFVAAGCSEGNSDSADAGLGRNDGSAQSDPNKTGMDAAATDAKATTDTTADVLAAPLPVRVIRGNPTRTMWWDLTVRGGGLQAYEGAVVTVRIGLPDNPPERIGSGQARIANGEFSLTFPQVWEQGAYKAKSVWIDVDGNGKCNYQIDRIFHDERGSAAPELYVGDAGPAEARMTLVTNSNQSDPCVVLAGAWPAQ